MNREKNINYLKELKIAITKKGLEFLEKKNPKKPELKDYKEYKSFFESKIDKNKKLYYIYRNSSPSNFSKLFKEANLRFDLTLILQGRVGKEPIRTIGHFHKKDKKTGKIPSEIYQVISGKAIFFLQSKNGSKNFAVSRSKGEKIIIPPEFGHITINQSRKFPLLIANIFIDSKKDSDYSKFEKFSGPEFYPAFKGEKIVFQKDKDYKHKSTIKKIVRYKKLPFGISLKKSLLEDFIKNPEKFDFIKNPKKYKKEIDPKNLF